MDIVIWDLDAQRIARIDRNLHRAFQQLSLPGLVTSMSEPPLLARIGFLGKVPLLEIEGCYWSLRPDEEVSLEQCVNLLRRLNTLREGA